MKTIEDINRTRQLEKMRKLSAPSQSSGPSVTQAFVGIFGASPLLAIAAFCVFGSLASFEPPDWVEWQLIFRAIGCGCLVGAVIIFRRRKLSAEK